MQVKLLVSLVVAATAFAQDTLVSPEVHPDGKSFRLYAPKAADVMIAGEWTRPNSTPTRLRR